MLYFSSLLFAAVVWTAHTYNSTHHVVLMLLATSVLHHAKFRDVYPAKSLVALADMVLAHVVVANELVRNVMCSNDATVYAFIVFVVAAHASNQLILGRRHDVHGVIHLAGAAGACLAICRNPSATCSLIL